jgi:hypothetical protein
VKESRVTSSFWIIHRFCLPGLAIQRAQRCTPVGRLSRLLVG